MIYAAAFISAVLYSSFNVKLVPRYQCHYMITFVSFVCTLEYFCWDVVPLCFLPFFKTKSELIYKGTYKWLTDDELLDLATHSVHKLEPVQ